MASVSLSRSDIEELVVSNATKHPQYRKALLEDAKKVIEKQLNNELPANLNVKVVQEDANTIFIVLPHAVEEGAELSDADLEAVAGGKGDDTYTCNEAIGGFNTRNEFSASVF